MPTESNWPVEVRLLTMILIQAAVFVLGKVIANKTGSNILNMFSSFTDGGGSMPQQSYQNVK